MKSIRHTSAARVVQICLNILWGFALIISGLLVVGFGVICFLPEYNPGGWSIMLDPESIRHSIEPKIAGLSQIRLEPGQLEMEFASPTRASTILFQIVRVIVALFVLLKILYLTRKIAFTWPDKSPFSMVNIQRLRTIALYVVIVPILLSLDLILTHLFLISKFDFPVDPGFFIDWELGMFGNILSRFHWEYLLFGFGLLALAEVFKTGLEYQEDSTSIL